MKKYKLIQEYPGSPKLGTEIKMDERSYNINNKEMFYYNGIWFNPEKYPSNWKEIFAGESDFDFEIVEFIDNKTGYILIKLDSGNWTNTFKSFSEEELKNNANFSISAVQDIHTKTIYSINDYVEYYGQICQIGSIYYNEHNQLSFKVSRQTAPRTGCFSNRKLKKVIITYK